MKKINQYIKDAQSNQQTISPEQEQQQSDLVDALFLKMEAIFGRKWLDSYPNLEIDDLVRQEWAEGIQGITLEQLTHGLAVCRDQHQWPPSIAEFRAACLGADDWEHKGAAYREFKRDRLLDSDERKARRKANAEKFKQAMKAKGLTS